MRSHPAPFSPASPALRGAAEPTRGFTLVEMLAVMAIMAIIAAVTIPLTTPLLRSNEMDSSVLTLSGILEEARESAVSENTFVWVAFADPPANSPATGLWVAVFQSEDGTESPINTTVTPAWANSITVPEPTNPNLSMLMKLQNLPGVKLVDPGALPASLTTQAAQADQTAATTLYESGLQWTVTTLQNTSLGAGHYFTHAIEFSPEGEARVPTWNSNVQFGLVPATGSATNASLFNISRLMGKITVYRL